VPQRSKQQGQLPRRPQQRQALGAASSPQRALAAAPLPQAYYTRVGRNGKLEKKPNGLEQINRSLPWDERMIVIERAAGAPQITPAMATNVVAHINVALSKVTPHVRTTVGKISARGPLSTMAREGASAAMLLLFRKEIIEAARKADKGVIDVAANESWVELKILVPYAQYRHPEGLADLKAQIAAENEGVETVALRWMRAKRVIEEHFQRGILPHGGASVVFKVPNKTAGQKLTTEMWVVGNKFKALQFIPNKADTVCGRCSGWGHSEFQCHQEELVCGICSGNHFTAGHLCEMATSGAIGRVCPHAVMNCPGCGGNHPSNDARCRAKRNAIAVARGVRGEAHQRRPGCWKVEVPTTNGTAEDPRLVSKATRQALARAPAEDWTEDPDEMEVVMEAETSGTVPAVAV